MNKELQQQLYDKYPELFAQKDLDKMQSCMCWGIACGDGWYDLVDSMCQEIHQECDRIGEQVEFAQIKEKFGRLRVYTDPYTESIESIVRKYCAKSAHVCEYCGSEEVVEFTKTGWIKALCEKCRREKGV